MKKTKNGFTLLELLVVVLIIGILAAIALPQYQKAVEKSKSAQGLALLKSVANSIQVYYMVNSTYPNKFDDLDVDIPWTGTESGLTISASKDRKSNENWAIQIEKNANVFALYMWRISGKYKGAGFIVVFMAKHASNLANENIIRCFERIKGANIIFDENLPEGSYCEGIMSATYKNEDDWTRLYTLN